MTNTVSLVTLFLFWKAQKTLAEIRNKKQLGTANGDAFEDDPLKYTTVKTFCIVPALLGAAKAIAIFSGKHRMMHDWWSSLAQSHTFYWFLKRIYLGNIILYLSLGMACLGLDTYKRPQFLYKHKVQPKASIDYSTALPKLAATLVMNLGFPVFFAMLPGTDKIKDVSLSVVSSFIRLSPEPPSIWEITKHYWGFLLTYDILFFYSHWALHTKQLYSLIHKQHHEWKSPTALAAAYAHPIEYILSNLAPAAIATVWLRPHILSFEIYLTIGLLITLAEHSGYEFVDTNAYHNLHHRTFTSNFGVSGVYDEIHGTRLYDRGHAFKIDKKDEPTNQ